MDVRFLSCEVTCRSCSVTPLDADALGSRPLYWPVGPGTTDDLDAY